MLVRKKRKLSISDGVKKAQVIKINLLQTEIKMHLLHTSLYTFLNVEIRRICLTIKNFFSW